jgi:predicted transcriptional regulator
MRRKILVFLGSERKSFEEIKERFNLNDNMANFHLSLLEEALYTKKKKRKEKYSISQLC